MSERDPARFLLNVHLANSAAKFPILLAKKIGKLGPARAERIEALNGKLRLDFGDLHRGGKAAYELGDLFLRRPCRCEHSEPVV